MDLERILWGYLKTMDFQKGAKMGQLFGTPRITIISVFRFTSFEKCKMKTKTYENNIVLNVSNLTT